MVRFFLEKVAMSKHNRERRKLFKLGVTKKQLGLKKKLAGEPLREAIKKAQEAQKAT